MRYISYFTYKTFRRGYGKGKPSQHCLPTCWIGLLYRYQHGVNMLEKKSSKKCWPTLIKYIDFFVNVG